MNPSRTGGLYVLPSTVFSEPMTSKRGRASVAPIPFRQVRRSTTTLLIIRHSLFLDSALFLHSAMRERLTGHDRTDERLHAVPIRGDILHQSVHHDFVIAFQPPA